jgi:hypothetical protein
MKKFLLAACFAFFSLFSLNAQVQLEDFEGGVADLTWNGINGIYNGVVSNPDITGINTSTGVGKYTNDPLFDFCFALTELAAPVNLSEFNLVKMKVWSPVAPSKVLFKFEGGGNQVEKFLDITEANKWVEYEFDLSAGADITTMNKILVSFNPFVLGDNSVFYFDDIRIEKNQRCYESFEGGAELPWVGADGVYSGAVANPTPNAVNASATCGQYTKSGAHAYSLLIADQGTPFDLSVYNQFKLKVLTSAPTQVLLKLEGPSGNIERTKNIAVANSWQEYVFDFSAEAANNTYTKVIIFFDPGVETSADTYYFDDLCAVPQGACSNATPNADILDDFECNRNATYGVGWDSLSVVKNPSPSADNNSSKVGKWNDPTGPGNEWYALVIDNNEIPADLTTKNILSVQVWAPKTGKVLLKLEGAPAPIPAKEVFIDVTETNKWITYSGDFSSEAGKGHKRWAIFLNAGVEAAPGDVYYIDNIKLSAPTALPALEDFQQATPNLTWQPLDENTLVHGVFTGPVANPAPNSINNSSQVGCYTKGTSPFSTLQVFPLPSGFSLENFAQLSIDVLSPLGGGTVQMRLTSPTQGNKEAEAEITTPAQWETLGFDFSAFSAITDFEEVRIIFNPGTANAGQTWCIDNLRQGVVTVDPCLGTVPVPNLIDDFECQRNNDYGAGNDKLTVINNPVLVAANPSLKVGEYKDPANDPWTALCALFPDGIDLSLYNQFSMQAYGPGVVPILFKLEGGTSPGFEIWDTLRVANAWNKFTVDFSAAAGGDYKRICIFFNGGQNNPETSYYIDNLRWQRAGYSGCLVDNQTPGLIEGWRYFANGALEAANYQFEIVDNPNPAGLNTSAKVGKFVKAGDALPFAGMYTFPDLEAPLKWNGNKTIRAKVHMDHIGNFAVKVEGDAVNGTQLEIPVANTKIGEWEELSFNFAAVPDNSEFRRLTIFFDLGINATGVDVTSYFDDIIIGNGSCLVSSVFGPTEATPLLVAPNPTSNVLRIENIEGVERIDVFNLYGQRVASVQTGGDQVTELDATRFPSGMYTISAFGKSGEIRGMAKFVKM